MTQDQPWDRQAVHDELNRVQADFRRLLAQATPATLAQRTTIPMTSEQYAGAGSRLAPAREP